MAEAIKVIANILGFTTVIFAFIANLDNVISLILGGIAVILGIIEVFNRVENLFMKRMDRKQKQRDFKANRTLEEEELDEYGKL